MTIKIAHLTSVHDRYDVRIYLKMCRSLARHGHKVWLVVVDGKGDETREGVSIVDAGASSGRADRMLRAPSRVFAKAVALDADIYHFHDPELLPIGLKLKRQGRTVIFDSHEDYPAAVMSKPYLPRIARPAIAWMARRYERRAAPKLDLVIAATPAIRRKFEALGCRAIDINNYPLLDELASGELWRPRQAEVCYVGGIAARRGVQEVVDAFAKTKTDARLNLVGRFSDVPTRDRAVASRGWARVNEFGQLSRAEVREVMSRSIAGVVTFLPAPNHYDSQPNKMFEYMSSGLAVISSDFPLWREIIAGNECGLCVDPTDPEAIAGAIDELVKNPARAHEMGANGRHAVTSKYNWEAEKIKLLSAYGDLFAARAGGEHSPTKESA